MAEYGWKPCPTYMILELIDPVEYTALSDAAKDRLKLILSCGAIDMRVSNVVHSWLFAIFPVGTTTNARLLARFSIPDLP